MLKEHKRFHLIQWKCGCLFALFARYHISIGIVPFLSFGLYLSMHRLRCYCFCIESHSVNNIPGTNRIRILQYARINSYYWIWILHYMQCGNCACSQWTQKSIRVFDNNIQTKWYLVDDLMIEMTALFSRICHVNVDGFECDTCKPG